MEKSFTKNSISKSCDRDDHRAVVPGKSVFKSISKKKSLKKNCCKATAASLNQRKIIIMQHDNAPSTQGDETKPADREQVKHNFSIIIVDYNQIRPRSRNWQMCNIYKTTSSSKNARGSIQVQQTRAAASNKQLVVSLLYQIHNRL